MNFFWNLNVGGIWSSGSTKLGELSKVSMRVNFIKNKTRVLLDTYFSYTPKWKLQIYFHFKFYWILLTLMIMKLSEELWPELQNISSILLQFRYLSFSCIVNVFFFSKANSQYLIMICKIHDLYFNLTDLFWNWNSSKTEDPSILLIPWWKDSIPEISGGSRTTNGDWRLKKRD